MARHGRRQGNNPKRRVVNSMQAAASVKQVLLDKASYVGSGHHKRNPADYEFRVTHPRPTKTLCDVTVVITRQQATAWMVAGIKRGMFSEPSAEGMPKYIWAVSPEGEAYEAKTHKNTPWEYHGYPLVREDVMREYILSVWRERHE